MCPKDEELDASDDFLTQFPENTFREEVEPLQEDVPSHSDIMRDEPDAGELDPAGPEPLAARNEDVEGWITETFKILSISTSMPPEIGETVLWTNVPVGGPPKCSPPRREYFHGIVRHTRTDESGVSWIYVE